MRTIQLVLVCSFFNIVVASCGGGDSPTQAGGVSRFDGAYTGSLVGTQENTGGVVSAPVTLTVTNGVVNGVVIGTGGADTFSGTVSSSGAITFAAPSSPSGAPCSTITWIGGVIVSSSGSAVMTGTWSAPGGGIDPAGPPGATCPHFSGTWTATRP